MVKLSASEINPPDQQLIQSIKLGPRWYGPLEVLEKVGKVCYKLKLPKGSKDHPVFHVEKLQKYFVSTDEKRNPPEPEPISIETGKEYEVKDTLSHKMVRGALYWLVQWAGLPIHEATWEAYLDLVDSNDDANEKLIEYCNNNECEDIEDLGLITKSEK